MLYEGANNDILLNLNSSLVLSSDPQGNFLFRSITQWSRYAHNKFKCVCLK